MKLSEVTNTSTLEQPTSTKRLKLSDIVKQESAPEQNSQPAPRRNIIDVAGDAPTREEIVKGAAALLQSGQKGKASVMLAAEAIRQAGKDVLTIPAHYVNQALLNAPRALTHTLGYEYPEKSGNRVIDAAAAGAGVMGALTSPIVKGVATLGGKVGLNSALRAKMLAGAATGAAYSPNENILDVKQRALQGAAGAALPAVVGGLGSVIKNVPRVLDKISRGGVTKEEAVRLSNEYGTANASLVDKVKNLLKTKGGEANDAYGKALASAPEGKQINIRPAIEQAGKRLKRLGLITEKGNMTELGKSEIARDSVYGKLLDFYNSADAISGVQNLEGKASLTEGQIVKASKAMRETMVNKDQYTFLRDKLNALYKNKPSDIDVSKVVNQFYADGEKSGIKGLQRARVLTREAYKMSDKFLNQNTGDLKIATEQKLSRVGMKNQLSKQEMDHIQELGRYINHPILEDAAKINRVNRALERIKLIKRRGGDMAIGAVGLEAVRRLVGK